MNLGNCREHCVSDSMSLELSHSCCLARFIFPLYLYAPSSLVTNTITASFFFFTLWGAFFVYSDGKRLGGGGLVMT